jgi:UDP-GlcNAc3NAcA epimerase
MPEETNRILADRVSRWLFCPTSTAVENLRREGIATGVHQIGGVMYDVAVMMRDRAREKSTILARLGIERGEFQLATLHRAQNTDTRDALAHSLGYPADAARDSALVLPLHPRTRQTAERYGLDFGSILVTDPVGYLDMIALLNGCTRVLTDSRGLQKEAYFFRKPCITLRSATEWMETVEAGWKGLWTGPDYEPRKDIGAYGDGAAAEKVVAVLAAEL